MLMASISMGVNILCASQGDVRARLIRTGPGNKVPVDEHHERSQLNPSLWISEMYSES